MSSISYWITPAHVFAIQAAWQPERRSSGSPRGARCSLCTQRRRRPVFIWYLFFPTGANLFQPALKESDRRESVRVSCDIDNRCHLGGKRFTQRGEKVARRFDAGASAAASLCDQSMIDGGKTACRRVSAKFNIFGILLVRQHAVVEDDHHDRKIHSARCFEFGPNMGKAAVADNRQHRIFRPRCLGAERER